MSNLFNFSFQVEASGDLSGAVAEIKKLNDQLSQMRQENIVLKVRHQYHSCVQENKKAFCSFQWEKVDTNSAN